MQKPIALYLGRFQPFHNGHLQVIKEALKKYRVKLAIGSTEQGGSTLSNPFTTKEREYMIRNVLSDEGIEIEGIFFVQDIPNDNEYVDHVKSICGAFEAIWGGEMDTTRELFQKAGVKVELTGRYGAISATKIRDLICNDGNWEALVPSAVQKQLVTINARGRLCSLKG